MRSSSSAASCYTSCPRASSRSATSACWPTAIADRRLLFVGCISTQSLQSQPRSLRNCSNWLSTAAALVASAEPCVSSPGFQPMPWPPIQRWPPPAQSTLPETPPTMSKQKTTPSPMPTSPSPVAASLCSKYLPPTSHLSHQPEPPTLFILVPVSISQPRRQNYPRHIAPGREPHSIPIETR